jgi:hypothetical protein
VLELSVTTLAIGLGTLILGVLLGPIPNDQPIHPRPAPEPQSALLAVGHEMPPPAEVASCMGLYLSPAGIARCGEIGPCVRG